DDERSEGVASPDTPLAFPEDDEHAEAAAAAAVEDAAKATAQDKVSRRAARSAPARLPPPIRPASIPISCSSLTSPSVQWAQEQRGVVASLSHENAHLLKQIEDFRARLHTSRSTNDSLKQIHQSKVMSSLPPLFPPPNLCSNQSIDPVRCYSTVISCFPCGGLPDSIRH
uniref:Uncharacterized protein n=1 Tax=Aegilops tauschii subsp. strangulata TaxID=200361 RepID=A0A453N0S7_AEGTS